MTGSDDVGGLVGRNESTVRKGSASGAVNGSDYGVGGLVGNNTGGSVTESYWDVRTTGRPASDGGTGLTTAQMTGDAARTNMTGLAFETVWQTRSGGYPVLKIQPLIRSSLHRRLLAFYLRARRLGPQSRSTRQAQSIRMELSRCMGGIPRATGTWMQLALKSRVLTSPPVRFKSP